MAKKRLLLVNDDMLENKSYIDSFVESFKKKDVDVTVVGSSYEALESLRMGKYDLIVTDVTLKDGETAGIDMIKRIRGIDKNIKIIVSTGYGDYYKEEAEKAGASGYFDKPYDMNKMFYEPLGLDVVLPKIPEPDPFIVPKSTQESLRRTMHEISNNHNDSLMISNMLRGTLIDYITELKPMLETKDKEKRAIYQNIEMILDTVVNDLNEIIAADKRAEDLLKKTSAAVYKHVDPDKVIVQL